MRFAGGKIVMALEGGYNLNSISNSVFACVKTLLEEKPIEKPLDGFLEDRPFKSTWSVIQEVLFGLLVPFLNNPIFIHLRLF